MNPDPLDPTIPLSGTPTLSSPNLLTAAEVFNRARPTTELRFPDGRLVRLPTALVLEHLAASDSPASDPFEGQDSHRDLMENESIAIPVIEEQLQVGKRTVVTGTVRLDKHIGVYDEALDIPLAVRSFEVERVVLNQPVEAAPPVRQEGDTTVYPLVEEQLVLTKQLILREEIRVTRRDSESRDTRTVSLRRESIEVIRT